MKAILIGYGEVGQAVEKVFGRNHKITIADPAQGYEWSGWPSKYGPQDLALVCIPWSDSFISIVQEYLVLSGAQACLVFSTVPIGTCARLGASHYPVEGKHPDISGDMERNTGVLGGKNDIVEMFLAEAGQDFYTLEKSEWTEFLKLRSLAYFAHLIEFARYSGKVAKDLGLPWEAVEAYDQVYNEVVSNRGQAHLSRPTLVPPEGPIGGHCVLPGVRILWEQYPDFILHTTLTRENSRAPEAGQTFVFSSDMDKDKTVLGYSLLGSKIKGATLATIHSGADIPLCDTLDQKRLGEIKTELLKGGLVKEKSLDIGSMTEKAMAQLPALLNILGVNLKPEDMGEIRKRVEDTIQKFQDQGIIPVVPGGANEKV